MEQRSSRKPVFIGIGAQKCASTWLHRILAEHPAVGVPEEKEVDFFSYRFDHGYQWYEQRFDAAWSSGLRAFGEISPSYFCEPAVPARLAQYQPGARILLSLRDPVERALSNHRHEVRVGHITGDDLSFEKGLRNNPMYVEQGRYATHLGNWLRHFPQEQILIVLMEDVESDPAEVCRMVYRFIGVDEAFVPAGFGSRFNRSYANRSAGLARAKDMMYSLTRAPALRWLWNAAAATGLRALYRGVNNVPSSAVIPRPRPDTLAELGRVFDPEIQELEKMIGRSLKSWRAH